MSEGNWWAAILAAVASGVVSYWIARISKAYDARGAAEAALIGSGPTIIAEQNRRMGEMQTEINRLWHEVQLAHKREQKCMQRVSVLEARLGIKPEANDRDFDG